MINFVEHNSTTALTDEDIHRDRHNRHNRIKLKKVHGLWFSKWNFPWNASGAASPKLIGSVMAECNEAQPESYEEWYRYYMSIHADDILKAAKKFFGYCMMSPNTTYQKMDFALALDHAIIHAVDETWEGYRREATLRQALQEAIDSTGVTGITVREADAFTDRSYKIDAEVVDAEGNIIAGVQVKTATFFGDFTTAKEWRKEMSAKHASYRRNTGAQTFLIHYEDEYKHLMTPILRIEDGYTASGDIFYDGTTDLTRVLRAS